MDTPEGVSEKAWAKAVALGWSRERWENVWARILALGPFKQGQLWKRMDEIEPMPRPVRIPKLPRVANVILQPKTPVGQDVTVGNYRFKAPQ